MRSRTRFFAALAAILLLAAVGGVASADERVAQKEPGEGEGLKFVKNIKTGTCDSGWRGTDHEVRTINGRDYAFANSYCPVKEGGGVYVIDVTNPAKAKIVAKVPCSVSQGDIQISADLKTLMQAHDSTGGPDSCTGLGKLGFLTIDISNPLKPKVIGHADTNGSHNITAHPKKPYVYNSTSDLLPPGDIQIWSIKNPAKPKLVNTVDSLPHAPHDISFNKKGTMAVTAAISHFDIFDTSDVENPSLIWTGQCPGCSITHDAKFTPNGQNILIGDEGGGGAPYPCPGGAWYFYDFSSQQVPVLTGIYEPGEFVVSRNNDGEVPAGCTSHVFDISDDGTKIAISWYSVGTRYLDISSAIGATVGAVGPPTGIIECGWYIPDDGDSWSSKFSTDDRWIFSNDIVRG
ncbi:MAG: LVIVD repeat-containing protein, partial [Actinomycetota bacterium]